MKMQYEKGKVEGRSFCLQWTCIIFNVNIRVWSSVTKTIANFYSSHSNSNETYNIIYFETNTFHVHYKLLIIGNNDHIYNVHCAKTLVDPNKKHCINYRTLKQTVHIQNIHKNNASNLIDSCKEQCNRNTSIDDVLNRNNHCRLEAFSYAPGDCLFDTFEVLLRFLYSTIEL